MIQQIFSAPEIEKTSQADLVTQESFDYTPLAPDIAQQMRTTAQRIRQMVKRTLEELLQIGRDLLAAKAALPHGCFGPWLRAEFGWTERTARNFMAVTERFGTKTDMISDLRIDPTAAYLLAAPSAPDEASAAAVQRAESGERITVSVAKEILDTLRRKAVRRARRPPEFPAEKLLGQVLEALESFRQRWNPQQFSLLARQLREFADSLEEKHRKKGAAG